MQVNTLIGYGHSTRLRAGTPAYRRQALRRAGTDTSHGLRGILSLTPRFSQRSFDIFSLEGRFQTIGPASFPHIYLQNHGILGHSVSESNFLFFQPIIPTLSYSNNP